MDKLNDLRKLSSEIDRCGICRSAGTGKQVFGEGDPDAKVMFVGEAPGRKEAETGRPFIGRSGQLLRSTINSIGLKEKDVYITSPVKYLPKRGTPSKKEILHSNLHFQIQLNCINPKILVLLGKTAISAVLNENIPVLKEHGKVIKKTGQNILLTLHPAAVLRFPKYKGLFLEDLKKLKKYLISS